MKMQLIEALVTARKIKLELGKALIFQAKDFDSYAKSKIGIFTFEVQVKDMSIPIMNMVSRAVMKHGGKMSGGFRQDPKSGNFYIPFKLGESR